GVFIIRYHLELILIVPLVAGFVSYYLHIAFKQASAAQNPERLYREVGLMAYLGVCVLAFTGLMFVEIPVLYQWFNVVPAAAPARAPTSIRPPLYPALVAAVYWAAGAGNVSAVRLLQAVLSLLTVAVAYRLGRELLSRRAALWLAGLCCFYPSLLAYNDLLLS